MRLLLAGHVSVLPILSSTFSYIVNILSTYSVVLCMGEKSMQLHYNLCSDVSNHMTGWYPRPQFSSCHHVCFILTKYSFLVAYEGVS
jgi:hypothetical protein